MRRSRLWFGLLLPLALMMAGCGLFGEDESGRSGTPRLGRLTLALQIGPDGRGFASAKSGKRAVNLARVEVKMTSAKGEVLCDTITSTGSRLSKEPAYLVTVPSASQELQLRYEITPSARWDITVKIVDDHDSTRFSGALVVEDLEAFEYLDGCIPVTPTYAVVDAVFDLPAAIESDGVPGSARGLKAVYVSRLEVSVDEAILTEARPYAGVAATSTDRRFITADPAKLMGAGATRFFRSSRDGEGLPVVVSHEYASISNNSFKVSVYGYVEGDTVGAERERLLYEGTQAMNLATARTDEVLPIEMTWKAVEAVPVQIQSGAFVRLGRAGKVVMQVVISGGVPL
jgi:hypothetical protein